MVACRAATWHRSGGARLEVDVDAPWRCGMMCDGVRKTQRWERSAPMSLECVCLSPWDRRTTDTAHRNGLVLAVHGALWDASRISERKAVLPGALGFSPPHAVGSSHAIKVLAVLSQQSYRVHVVSRILTERTVPDERAGDTGASACIWSSGSLPQGPWPGTP